MPEPFMLASLVFIPKIIAYPVLLLLSGVIMLFWKTTLEFGFLPHRRLFRTGAFCIPLLLWQIFYASWGALPTWLQWYLNLGTVLMVKTVISTLLDIPARTYLMGRLGLHVSHGHYFSQTLSMVLIPLYTLNSCAFALVVPFQLG